MIISLVALFSGVFFLMVLFNNVIHIISELDMAELKDPYESGKLTARMVLNLAFLVFIFFIFKTALRFFKKTNILVSRNEKAKEELLDQFFL